MPLAVTHVLVSIILVDLYRDYITKHKKYFTLHTLFIAGLGGLAPDIDIPLNWLTSRLGFELIHRGITHTLLFGLLFLVPGLILWKYKHHKKAMYFFVIVLGIFLHISMDFFFISNTEIDGIRFFYPFSSTAYSVPTIWNENIAGHTAALDAFILLFWLLYEERRHKIRDFI